MSRLVAQGGESRRLFFCLAEVVKDVMGTIRFETINGKMLYFSGEMFRTG